MPRRPNGHAAPYQGADDWWHCHVTVGVKPDGSLKRKHVRRRTQTACADEVDRVRRQARAGERVVSKAPTVAEWLDHWLETIVKPNRRWKTYAAYEPIVRLHLKPRLGSWRISGTRHVLQPEHVDAAYAELQERGYAPSYVLQCHRILSRALKVAVRRGRASRNVCDLVDPPSVSRRRPKPLSMDAVKKIVAAVAEDRMSARWLIALMLGLRQGEVLGLRWRNVDLDAPQPFVQLEKQAQRRTWRHGCDEPVACARKHCRTKPCPKDCDRHQGKKGCPPVCAPGCTKHARTCPEKVGGGIVFVDLKSERSERPLPLDPTLVRALKEHRRAQLAERMALGKGRPQGDDLIFSSPFGTPIDPRRDHDAWEKVLERAGLPDAALHAARHTAATVLLATGTDIAVVQEILGHTDIRTTRGYTDVAAKLKREAVERMANVLFGGSLDALVRHSNATSTAL